MVILRNSGVYAMLRDMRGKRILLFGCGGSLHDFLKQYGNLIERDVAAILDNNAGKCGALLRLDERDIEISNPAAYARQSRLKDRLFLIITSTAYEEILKQLDGMACFDGMDCYIWNYPFLCDMSRTESAPEAQGYGTEVQGRSPEAQRYEAEAQGRGVAAAEGAMEDKGSGAEEELIPRVIHYCWFGPKPVPELAKRCVASWRAHCPDYEIRLWNESNYDVAKSEYMKQAYDAGKYSFVSDYARLDLLYRYGGIYLDTDVELISGLDFLLKYKAFFAYEYRNLIATGLGFGCCKNNRTVRELLDIYETASFRNEDGSLNLKSCPEYHTEYFRERGVPIDNTTRIAGGTLFLASEYLCSFNQETALYELTDRSVGIHHYACSWFEENELLKWNQEKSGRDSWNRRLYRDYLTDRGGARDAGGQ